MRLFLVFAIGMVFSSTTLAKKELLHFPAGKLSVLSSKKISDVFCDKASSYQLKLACSELNSANDTLDWVAPKIDVDSTTSFIIRSGNIGTKVSRTKEPTVFEVNYKKINMSDYSSVIALKEAVKNTLPKYSIFSVFMNEAYAEGVSNQPKNVSLDHMVTTISLILKATSDQDICQSATELAKACGHYPGSGSQSLLSIVSIVSNRMIETRKMESIQEVLARGMSKNERMSFDIAHTVFSTELLILSANLSSLKSKKEMLLSCPSVQANTGASSWDDISDCHKSIIKTYTHVKTLPAEILPILRGTDKDLANLKYFQDQMTSSPQAPSDSKKVVP